MSSSKQEYTSTGKRTKPDKWANILKAKSEEYYALVKRVNDLEDEYTSLRVKEAMLLQVLDIMQALVAEVADQVLSGAPGAQTAATAVQPAAADAQPHTPGSRPGSDGNLLWHLVLATVQQREQEIRDWYGSLLSSLCPYHQKHMQGIQMLTAMCSPHNVQQVTTMTAQQLTARLSVLAGRCALQILREPEAPPGVAAADASISSGLWDTYMEFAALIMSAMVWHNTKFNTIINTNLDTLQSFEQDLPATHWLNALQQLQLSEHQLRVLSYVHNQHYQTGRKRVRQLMERNLQQQTEHTEALVSMLQQQALQDHPEAVTATQPGGGKGPARPQDTGRAAGATQGAPSQVEHMSESQEALLDEQSNLLRQWLLLGLHVGIVTACTLSPYQQAVFVAAAYPSIPRMDLALAAYEEQVQKQVEGSASDATTATACKGGTNSTPSR